MDIELLKYLSSLGVGGILAGVLFMFYRKDVKHYTDQWKGQSEMLNKVVMDNTYALTQNTDAINSLKEHILLKDN